MRRLVATNWLMHGESGVPLWLIAPVAAVAVYFVVRWLRAERRRASLASSLLPFTGALLVLLAAWLIWKPALIRIDRWEYPSEVVALLDESASMDTPLVGSGLSGQLDVLELWEPSSVQGRPTAARDLARGLERLVSEAGQLRRDLRRALDEIEQGMPPGPGAADALANCRTWVQSSRDMVFPAIEAVRAEAAVPAEDESKTLPAPLETALTGLTECFSQLDRDAAGTGTDAMAANERGLEKLSAALDAADGPLARMQSAANTAYAAERKADLAPRLQRVARTSRLDAARRLLKKIPSARTITTSTDADGRDQTDLHGEIARLLDNRHERTSPGTREARVISDLVVLSDGGQNAGTREGLTRRLEKSGIRVTAAGIGHPERRADLAILDWRIPRILSVRQQTALRVLIKTPSTEKREVTLSVSASDQLSAVTVTTLGAPQQWVRIPLVLPEAGRHSLSIKIETPNANPDNDRVTFAVDVVERTPKALMVGHEPDWDTTYMYLAMLAAGADAQQIHHGLSDAPPRRGGSRQAIPKTESQWSRHRAVILHGRPFRGFDEDDAKALLRYVSEGGGGLIVFVNADESYIDSLAGAFGWEQGHEALPDARLALTPAARHLPVMRLATDGAASGRLLAGLGACAGARRVPAQHIPVLSAPSGDVVLSLGFYGKGKVYLCGIEGLHRVSEYANADVVKRFLAQLVGDAAAPLFDPDDAPLAVYPSLPVRGRPNVLISLAQDATEARLEGAQAPLGLRPGVANRWGVLAPDTLGRRAISVGPHSFPIEVIDNPGLEQIHYEFDADFLKDLAEEAGGTYLGLEQAQSALGRLEPRSWQGSTAKRYALADHWGLLVALAVAGTLHWVLRKLSGLAI